ncbi:MAG: hydroxymethylbilane synthase [bacterium]|nr:hydroxymethylbilane synthase [bacterium]
MSTLLRLGTRASALALAQSGQIATDLRGLGIDVRLVPLETPGDRDSSPLPGRAHEGIFVSSVRDALLDGTIDVAVHSFMDLPTDHTPGLMVAAVPPREDPRDVLISRPEFAALGHGLNALPVGGRVGTCSARRAAWVHRHRQDLDVVPIRGNIDARIARVLTGEYDAIILAAAGLNRLRCSSPRQDTIDIDDLVPAPAQGALALECRVADATTLRLIQSLDHLGTHACALAEREVLSAIDPTDRVPVGAVAIMRGGVLRLLVDISDADGRNRTILRTGANIAGDAKARAIALGRSAAIAMMDSHARTVQALAS